ncbi:hypothetical protein DYH09_06210 [bacterium CPR1]|nr:hypothetical protein [bacterium CPR1]
MKRQSAISLAELLTAIFLFGLFGLMVLASLQLALRQWTSVSGRMRVAQQARFVLGVMQDELRQGIPWRDATDGYLRVGASTGPTALLMPNETTPSSDVLEFTEPHPQYYLPLSGGWNSEAAANFRNVTYRINGLDVVREVRTHDKVPPDPPEVEVISSARPGATVALAFTYLSPSMCELAVTSTAGDDTETVRTRCFIVGK